MAARSLSLTGLGLSRACLGASELEREGKTQPIAEPEWNQEMANTPVARLSAKKLHPPPPSWSLLALPQPHKEVQSRLGRTAATIHAQGGFCRLKHHHKNTNP